MLRRNFQQAGGLNFELVKAGKHTLIWDVIKESEHVRFEVWNTFRSVHGYEDFSESDTITFGSLTNAEEYFNKHENNN